MIQYTLQTVPDGHECLSALTTLNKKLYNFGKQFKNIACVSTNIEVDLARLDLCPSGHTNHTSILNDLAISFSFCYVQEGNISDLNRCIQIKQIRLDLCPLGHPEHMHALGELAITLWKHYCIQENKADLDRLIEMEQKWLDLCYVFFPLAPQSPSSLLTRLPKDSSTPHRPCLVLTPALVPSSLR